MMNIAKIVGASVAVAPYHGVLQSTEAFCLAPNSKSGCATELKLAEHDESVSPAEIPAPHAAQEKLELQAAKNNQSKSVSQVVAQHWDDARDSLRSACESCCAAISKHADDAFSGLRSGCKSLDQTYRLSERSKGASSALRGASESMAKAAAPYGKALEKNASKLAEDSLRYLSKKKTQDKIKKGAGAAAALWLWLSVWSYGAHCSGNNVNVSEDGEVRGGTSLHNWEKLQTDLVSKPFVSGGTGWCAPREFHHYSKAEAKAVLSKVDEMSNAAGDAFGDAAKSTADFFKGMGWESGAEFLNAKRARSSWTKTSAMLRMWSRIALPSSLWKTSAAGPSASRTR